MTSVLIKLINERQEWANRQKVLVARQNYARTVALHLALALLSLLPLLVFLFREELEIIMGIWLH